MNEAKFRSALTSAADAPTDDPNQLWQTLRRQMERIQAAQSGAVDPAALKKRLADRAKVLRGRVERDLLQGESLAFLAFTKGTGRYGIPIADIIEIQPFEQYSVVPGTPPFISGVIHWRGEILSLLDLDKLFGLRTLGITDVRACVIVEVGSWRIGVLAFQIEELCTVPISRIRSAPDLSAEIPSEWIVGVYDENRLILRLGSLLQDPRIEGWMEVR